MTLPSASSSKSSSIILKAQQKAESWEIANLGRNQIELVHLIYERLERLVSVADVEASKAMTEFLARQRSQHGESSDAASPGKMKQSHPLLCIGHRMPSGWTWVRASPRAVRR